MKIISWNLNGIRSAEKEFLGFLSEFSPDIVLLQEVRAHPDQLSFFLKQQKNYKIFWNPAERLGYSGTAVYIKDAIKLKNTKIGMDEEKFSVEGRTITLELQNYYVINTYTPNGGSGKDRLKYKLDYYEKLRKFTKKLMRKKPVVVGGDLNVAHTEKDVFAPERYKNFSAFLPEERKWFGDVLALGLVDSFREFEKDGENYSWWHMKDPKRIQNRGWRFDYFLVDKRLKDQLQNAFIMKEVFGSDHCPVGVDLK